MKDKQISPRETALRILYEIEANHAYANIALKKYLKETDYKIVDRGFITELVYGIIKFKVTIDYIIGRYSSIKINKISKWILNILRMGVYQMIYLDRVPASAACNESVKLAKKYGHRASVGFVNAVLRNIAKGSENIQYPDRTADPVGYLKIKYSHPGWMVEKWLDRYGFDFTESLCAANNEIPDLCVRVNTLKTTPQQLETDLKQEGVEVYPGKYCGEALILKNVGNIEQLRAFKDGLFQVQDESSMMVSKVLAPEPGELVMDVCCAPGGKTTHIAQLMENRGSVVGWDIHPHKVELVRSAVKRLGLSIVKLEAHDATVGMEDLLEKADRVLVDAPCSGLGIIRRKPDIKWNKINENMKDIVELQKKILKVSSGYVKHGGYLVYSTCTIQEEENIEVIKDFLQNNTDYHLESIEKYVPEPLMNDRNKKTSTEGYLQLYPHTDHTDGFFICKLKRIVQNFCG